MVINFIEKKEHKVNNIFWKWIKMFISSCCT